MRRGDLLIIAERAIELVPKATLKALVGDYVHVDDLAEASATPNAFLDEVQTFHIDSLAGRYFEDFAVNSSNCTDIPGASDAFIAEFKRLLLAGCISAADSGQYEVARQAFELLFGLLRHIDECHDDVLFFADEGGSWQLGIDWHSAFAAYFSVPGHETAHGRGFRDQCRPDDRRLRPNMSDHSNLRSAHSVANAAQRATLEPLEPACRLTASVAEHGSWARRCLRPPLATAPDSRLLLPGQRVLNMP
ncbi:hypothetical protein [Candidatus Accumulibacter sp. ACC005]|uniref:hypothetical protein n=1 Tax=Candidatus Accumulibacter sp. ACC005 TaxID=2823331 RepID=UPI0025BFD488|nr:hypothetical protein [Candidatus Accumulibacter sp. ACC005]